MHYANRLDQVLFENVDKQIMQMVFDKLKETKKGKLAKPLKTGQLDMESIYRALRSQRCLKTDEYDIGPMYLKSAIAGAIHDTLPENLVNMARRLFGLKPKKQKRPKGPEGVRDIYSGQQPR